MTVSTVVNHNEYTGNGVTTSFPYTFRIFKKTDLTVSVIDLSENITVLVLDTDYTVTNAGGYNGGNVVLTSPLANGWQISISRELEPTQETDLRNQGKFFAEVHEDAFDKLTMLIQQVSSLFRLALRKPSSIANWYDALNNYIRNLKDPRDPQDAATKNYTDNLVGSNFNRTLRVPESYIPQLPPANLRANMIQGFDSAGNPVMLVPQSGSAADVLLQLASTDPGKGDALIAVKQPYTNSVARTQHDVNADYISVKDFGAVGDGVTDDTSAIQNALNAVKNFSATLFIPSGTYLISDTLTVYSETVVVGSGRSSVIKMAPNVNKDILKSVNADNLWGVTDKSVLDSAEQLYDLTLQDFVIDGGVTDWSDKPKGNGISIWGSRLDFSGIGIFNIAGCGLRTEFSDNGVPYQKQWIESSFHNIRIERCGMECWKFRGPADAKANMISLLDGSRYEHSLYSGLDVANHGATFANVHVSHDYNDPRGYVRHFAAVNVSAPSSFVSGCQFEGAEHANLLISDTSNVNFGADTNIYAAYSDCNVRLAGNVSKILLLGLISSPMSTSSGSNGIVCDSTARISNSTIQMTMWGQSRTALVLGDSADVGGNSIYITSHSDDGTLYAGKLNTAAGSVYDLKMLGSSSVRSFVNSNYQKIRITAAANTATSVTFPLVCGATPYIMVQPVDASSDVDKLLVPVNVSNTACKVYNPNSFSIDCFLLITSM